MGMPSVVCAGQHVMLSRPLDSCFSCWGNTACVERESVGAYIDGQVEEIEGARIRHVVVGSPAQQPLAGRHRRRLQLDGEAARRQHGHEDVGHVHQHGADHLLGHVEEPDLERPLRPLAPPLVHQRQQRQPAQRELHHDGERGPAAGTPPCSYWGRPSGLPPPPPPPPPPLSRPAAIVEVTTEAKRAAGVGVGCEGMPTPIVWMETAASVGCVGRGGERERCEQGAIFGESGEEGLGELAGSSHELESRRRLGWVAPLRDGRGRIGRRA